MKSLFTQLILSGCMLLTGRCLAQSHWPKTIYNPGGGSIKIYKPQVESFTGSILKSKTTIALLAYGDDDPIFGVAWTTDTVKTDRDKREVTIQSVRVDNLRIAADNAPFTEADVRKALEVCIPSLIRRLPLDGVLASLDQSDEDTKLAGDIGNKPPKLIFRTSPSILVPIDGQPILRENKEWGLDVVVNSPATIIKDKDGQFYLYAGGNWYVAPAATGPYGYKDKVGRPLKEIGRGLEKAAKKNGGPAAGGPAGGGVAEGGPGGPAGGSGGSVGSGGPAAGVKGRAPAYDIVVSTVPAELIQTDGSPDMQPAAATALRYAANSGDAILMDTTTKQYYVLLSGRWYRSDSLTENGQWQYVAADRLPKDFARIPESSPIADVLPSVAGTPEAKDAVMDAQVPQLEKIDRRTATTEVVYDGEPEFQSIEGTDMMYAMNTCSTVLSWQDRYYAVDDGVWFTAGSPLGPWTASTVRPAEMDLLPPDCPVYNARYADVYHVSNNYVYDGYTPGYLNSYIDNCTVVYGTGFYYSPWRGNFYYPRPWTWGFGMCYDPWYGWGFGMDYDDDLFDCGWGWDAGFGFVWGGGYGGGSRGLPGIYHPAYPVGKPGRHGRYDRHGGYVVINRGQRGPQGQGQRLVNGRAAAVPAGTVAGTGTTGTRTVARPGYGGSRTGGYAGMRGGGGGYGGRGSNGGGYAGGRSVGASGGGYAGGRSGGGYSGGGSRGGGYSGGGASGGGGNSGGGGGHVGSSGGGGASGGGGGGGHVSSGGGGGSSSGGGGGGHH